MANTFNGTLFPYRKKAGNPGDESQHVDHTFITSYYAEQGGIKNPPDANYWYCYGGLDQPDGPLSGKDGFQADLDMARYISKPDAPNGAGKFLTNHDYQGPCQQLSNQILYSTGNETTEPQRVIDAHGYYIGNFFYGNYGLSDAWDNYVATDEKAKQIKAPKDDFCAMLDSFPISEISGAAKDYILAVRNNIQFGLRQGAGVIPEPPKMYDYFAFALAGVYLRLLIDDPLNPLKSLVNFYNLFRLGDFGIRVETMTALLSHDELVSIIKSLYPQA